MERSTLEYGCAGCAGGGVMADRQLTAALAGSATIAATAPSLRRSKPWRWVLRTEALDLYADPMAELTREETLMTCGGAVHRARVALAADGLAVRVDLLPDSDPDHVATITPTGSTEVTDEARRLARAAQSEDPATTAQPEDRATTAQPGDSTTAPLELAAVPDPATIDALAEAARAEGADLRVLERDEADQLAGATPLLATSAQAGVRRDGSTTYAVLYGTSATPPAWLAAGQAFSAIDLRATQAGVSVVASAAVVELSRSRQVLRRILPDGATPYLALRIRSSAQPLERERRSHAGQLGWRPLAPDKRRS
jgi:hypothetical protein